MSRSPRMSGEARREQLLDKTLELVAREGFRAVSIDAVAREAGITRPIVYGHFQDLPGLLNALLDREARRAIGQLAGVLPSADDERPVWDVALGALRAYLEVVAASPLTWQLILMPVEGAPPTLHARVEGDRAAVRVQLAAALEAGLRREGLDPQTVDLDLAAHIAQGVSEHLARLVLTDPQAYDVARIMALAEQGVAVVAAVAR
ncbi:MAG: TetR/AcrR family transcriptional regulator [Baekduiaceae bacterium]